MFNYLVTHMGIILQQKDSWKAELKEFSSKNGYDLNRNVDSPLLLDVLQGFLKFEV
jgi:FGFR1 oncogene partner